MATKRRDTEPDVAVALPIVPMLDLSFQILFFFIITFNPSRAEGRMSMNLPASGEAKAKDSADVNPKMSDPELNLDADFAVLIRSYDDSFSLSVRNSEKVDEIGTIRGLAPMTPNERKAEIDKLIDKLRETLANRLKDLRDKDPDKAADNVKIEPNSKTKNGAVVAVMDACVRAGYSQVGFVAPPDLNQP
jgi:biopolymer transport protein ExbD